MVACESRARQNHTRPLPDLSTSHLFSACDLYRYFLSRLRSTFEKVKITSSMIAIHAASMNIHPPVVISGAVVSAWIIASCLKLLIISLLFLLERRIHPAGWRVIVILLPAAG